ncbi:MAG TPA: hypothetical protein VMT80_02510 [Candidatus Paceibacterota bacterium]|nr:hypothetical protein [Candidatus Paceibacterota bacterium]
MKYLTNAENIKEQLMGLTGKKEKHLERARNVVVLSKGVAQADQHSAMRDITDAIKTVQKQSGGNGATRQGVLACLNTAKHNVEHLDYGGPAKGTQFELPTTPREGPRNAASAVMAS